MKPDEVFVVYNGDDDEIISVHSTRTFALMARQEIVNDTLKTLEKTCAYLDADDETRIKLKYSVGTLQESIQWLLTPLDS